MIYDYVIFHRKEDLRGKKIVFTGALSSCTRKEASSQAEQLGCMVMSGVSKNVDVVVVGDGAGQKLDKAKSLGMHFGLGCYHFLP